MFNKGRPRKHVHIAFFTYETHDGKILTYEMNSKGPLKKINNQNTHQLQLQQEPSNTNVQNENNNETNLNSEMPFTDTPFDQFDFPLNNEMRMGHSLSNENLFFQDMNFQSQSGEDQNLINLLNNQTTFDNTEFDEYFYNYENFVHDELKENDSKNNQYFKGLSD